MASSGGTVARDIVAGGFRTRYLEAGPVQTADAPTVLLVHDGAFGADAGVTWSRLISRLSTRYRVVAPDLLGYGGTDKVVFFGQPPYRSRVEHLAAFCEVLGLADVHAVGSSFGGSVLLRALAGGGSLPLRTVTSIAGTGGPWRALETAAALTDYDGTERDMERIVRLMVDDYPGLAEQVHARYLNTLRPGHVEACIAPRLSNPAAPHRPATDGWPSPLERNSVPILLLSGARDELLEPDWTGHFSGLPHVSTRELDCRHAPNLDQPDALLDVLVPFFESAPVPGGPAATPFDRTAAGRA